MKRLFVAIKVIPEVVFLSLFDELKKDLKHEKIKWVEVHNLHLTLKFFGETPENKMPEIITALKAGIEKHKQFAFKIKSLGIFGSRYNPKLIWAGLQNTIPLVHLATDVNTELEKIGYNYDRQNFVPHLTLGRIKFLRDKNLFQDIIVDYKDEYFQDVFVEEVYLLESVLTKEGPIYQIIEKFELK